VWSALARLGEVELLASHVDWIAHAAARAIVAGHDVVLPFARA
jgi:hypothetical protein